MTFVDLEGDGPRSFADVQALMDETPPDMAPTANIQRLSGRLQMRFPEPVAWNFRARGRLLGASFRYGSFDMDLVFAEADAAYAAVFDADNDTVFPPLSLDWPWIDADWAVEHPPDPDPSPRLAMVEVGDRVSHRDYGNGTVLAASGPAEGTKIKVAFDDAGTRSLSLLYAPLRLL